MGFSQCLLLLLASGTVAHGAVYTEDEKEQKALWETFKADHEKSYESEAEEQRRFGFFVDNLKLADEHHAEAAASGIEDHSRHGITQYFDLDLRNDFHNIAPPIFAANEPNLGEPTEEEKTHLRKLKRCHVDNNLVDWTGVYTSGPVQNAMFCLGSGWAFAVSQQLESDSIRMHGSSYNHVLSAQQLLDCVSSNDACRGGSTEAAYNYLVNNGLAPCNNYRFTSYWGTGRQCTYNADLGVAKVASYSASLAGDEKCMAEYVQETGTLSVCVHASNAWYTYRGGTMSKSTCSSGDNEINHCLQVVGVKPSGSNGYWRLRNNAGTRWGDQGFINIEYDEDACRITNNPIYTSTQVDF